MSQLQVTGEAKIRDIQGPVVANSGVITALDGAASQYVRGDGTLADFPTSTGGGSSVSYYLNSSVSQGTIGGVAYRELSKEPIIGAGTDITISANGYVASYITDANDPDVLSVPGGNFNCEFYFSVNNNTGNPTTYAELYKYDGTTFTLLGSSVAVPESLNQGTTIAPYYFAIPVATAALALTDRLAIRIYVNVDGRTVTLHTENSHLCQVVTTFSKGMVSLNNLTDQSQFITTGTSGTNFNIVSSGDTHTFNLPVASATNTGKLSSTDWSTFNAKQPAGNYVTLDTTQTITAEKTFSVSPISESGYSFKILASGTPFQNGYSLISSIEGSVSITQALSAGNLKAFTFDFSDWNINTTRTYTLPDASGTLALTSNLSSYVPYTGATANVDLGLFGLTSNAVKAIGDNSTYGGVISIKQNNVIGGLIGTGYTELFGKTNRLGISFGAGSIAYLSNSVLTAERTYTLPDLSGTLALLEGTQTFSGSKTFTQSPISEGGYSFKILASGTLFGNGYSVISSLAGNVSISQAISAGNLKSFTFDFSSWATNTFYTYALPASDGTIALTSDLGAYVTLATTQTITANKTFSEFGFFDKGVLIKQGNYPASSGYNSIGALSGGFYFGMGQTSVHSLNFSTSNSYNYTFPNASGTLALTSNLSAYLPLTGGTLTGNLTINPSTTDYTLTVSTSTTNNTIKLLGSTASNTSTIGYWSSNGGTGYGALNFTPTNTRFEIVNGGSFSIYTSGNERLTVASGGTTTLTGALSGTSATFSGNVLMGTATSNGARLEIKQANSLDYRGLLVVDSATPNWIGIAHTGTAGVISAWYDGAGTATPLIFKTGDTTRLTIASTGLATFSNSIVLSATGYIGFGGGTNYIEGDNTNNILRFGTNNVTRLTIASTGAATFSSSVTAGGELSTTSGLISISGAGATPPTGGVGLRFVSNRLLIYGGSSDITFQKNDNSGPNLTILNSGAATFSGSVTANGLYANAGNSARFYRGANDYYWGVNNDSNNYLNFGTFAANGTAYGTNPKMILLDNGNVGIGITNPGAKLQVKTSTSAGATDAFYIENTSLALFGVRDDGLTYMRGNVLIGTTTDSGQRLRVVGASGTIARITDGTNNLDFYCGSSLNEIAATTSLLLSTNGATRLTIASTGAATFSSSVTLNSEVRVKTATTSGVGLSKDSSGAYLYNIDNTFMAFGTNDTERMRITSGGNVGIGTSSINYKLEVVNSTNQYVFHSFNTRNTSGDTNVLLQLGNNCNNTGSYFLVASMPLGDRMYIYGNGNIVNINGSYGTLSDATLKENIIDATPKLADILNLKVRNFNLIGDDTKQIGFIAQEFEEVFPSMIDLDGKSGKKAIKTSVLTPMLVKGLQELKAEKDAEILELRSQIEELKALIAAK